jgi:[acyl-carrier-protein] S-malonyltransferase
MAVTEEAPDSAADSSWPPLEPTDHWGEHLLTLERMVVSPASGIFMPVEPWTECRHGPIVAGAILGHIGAVEVRSFFTGHIMEVLAEAGQRVTTSQPIAWLRVA